jgi:hypothetical protein
MTMHTCFKNSLSIAIAWIVLLSSCPMWAQEIVRFEDGYLTFTNENPALYYRIEFRPNLIDPVDWDGTYRGLRNLQSSDAEVTVPVGLFYRVVGRETPWVAGTAVDSDLLAGKTAYVNDEEITGTMADIGRQEITPGTSAQTIAQGYHDGTGSVAGDSDLVAENIKKHVAIFGVVGTFEGGGGATYNGAVPKTGQTTVYRAGDDGTHQKGGAWPNPRFTDHGNTVTDEMTGLMWVKAPHTVSNNSGGKTWNQAIDVGNAMNAGAGTFGYTDWRLPNVSEMQSLMDFGRSSPALPAGHPFTGLFMAHYWTSSTCNRDGTQAYVVAMGAGSVGYTFKTMSNYAWPVRGGD